MGRLGAEIACGPLVQVLNADRYRIGMTELAVLIISLYCLSVCIAVRPSACLLPSPSLCVAILITEVRADQKKVDPQTDAVANLEGIITRLSH